MLREKVAAKEIVKEAPYHRRDKEQDKKRMPPLQGAAAYRGNQQGYISNCGDKRE